MPLAPPITAIQQPAVGIYGLPVGASAGAMVQLSAAQIRAHADLSSYLTSAAAAIAYVPYTGATGAVNLGNNALTVGAITASGNLTLQNSTTAVLETIEKTFTSSTNREYIQSGWNATDSAYDVGVSYQGSVGGSLQAVRIGNRSAAGVFSGLTVATSGAVSVSSSTSAVLSLSSPAVSFGFPVSFTLTSGPGLIMATGSVVTASVNGGFAIVNGASSATVPCFAFRSDLTTGMGTPSSGSGIITWTISGVERMRLTSIGLTCDAITARGVIKPQQATTAAAPAYALGAIYFDTTLNKLRIGGATAWETVTSV